MWMNGGSNGPKHQLPTTCSLDVASEVFMLHLAKTVAVDFNTPALGDLLSKFKAWPAYYDAFKKEGADTTFIEAYPDKVRLLIAFTREMLDGDFYGTLQVA